jgi:EAL domain-containing protein (putative c-di-GMP-specific phosphodiesterase class I)
VRLKRPTHHNVSEEIARSEEGAPSNIAIAADAPAATPSSVPGAPAPAPVSHSLIPVPDLDLDGVPSLVFQPAVDLDTGRLLGFEALLRWHRFDGTSVSPSVLIPLAEASGRMNELNKWVIAEACAQGARWPSDLQLAVNCSVFQLQRGNAALATAAALEQSGLNPDRLTVEITESSVADDDAGRDLEAMTGLGIQLTVDDVGEDWSVLQNFRGCVVNTMKIDASLVAGLSLAGGRSRGTIDTIVNVCRTLGVCTVAEAVESAKQVAILREIGVDAAQGYFFSPPMEPEETAALASIEPHLCFELGEHPLDR